MQDISWIFVASLLLLRCSATIAELNVNISVDYNPPPGFTPGPNEYRAASGPVIVTCTAKGPETGAVSYWWSSTCRDCPFQSSKRGSTLRVIRRGAVHSGDNGIHTCSASNDKSNGSASITFIVVGVGIHVFDGNPFGSFPNNGLIISSTMNQSKVFYTFRFFCRSDSMEANVGYLIGLKEENITTDNHFTIDNSQPGELKVINGTQNLTTSEQGVYTCRIPLRNGTIKEINIGVYPNGFKTKPNITNLMFSPGNTSSNLTCISTGSPATNVTWMRDGQPLTIDGSIYQQIQRVTNRTESTYENILITNNQLTAIIDHNYTCKINNTLGVGVQDIVIPPIVIITEHGSPTAGETSFSLNCTAVLPNWAHVLGKLSIEFTNIRAGFDIIMNDITVMVDNSTFTRIIQFTPLQISHGGDYVCQAIFNSTTVARNISFTVERPNLTVNISEAGALIVGRNYTFSCSVQGGEKLAGKTVFVWMNSTGNVIATVDALHFQSLRLSDAGQYTCLSTIAGSPYLDANVTLSVNKSTAISIKIPPPAVSVTSPDNGLIYYAGSTLTLICTTNEVNELTGIAVTNTWTGPRGENILDSSQNERITVSDATKADNGTYTSMLVLTPLHMSDTGNYSCQAGVSHMSEFILSSDSSTSQVIISVQAPNITLMTSSEGSGAAGEEYSIICNVNGADDLDAEFHLMWIAQNTGEVVNQTRNDNHLTHTFRADIADAGLYTCIANITYLNSSLILNNTISITIQIPTPTVSITHGSETPIYAGSNLSLICTITLNGIPMDALRNITVNSSWAGLFEKANERATSDVIQNNTVFTSTLMVTMLHISDTGNYSCRAIISHTSDLILSSETGLKEDIIVVEAPVLSVETSTKGSGVAGETLTICCFVNGTENLAANFTLTWMDKNGNIVKRYTGRDSNLTHTFNPKVSDAGLYVCSSVITSPYLVDNALSRNETLNVHIQAQNVSDVSVMTSSEGSATAGEEYSIICKVNGADNLDAEFHLMWVAQNKSEVASQRRNDSHLTHTFTADIADAGLYTCIANITSSCINSSLILNTTMNITIQIPTPTVSITHGSETPIYAGSNLSLTCTITLNGIPMVALRNITVNSSWAGPFENSIEGVRISFTDATQENDTVFTSILMITTLHLSDNGNYSCRATVDHISDLILSSETCLKEKLIAVTAPRVSMETSTKGSRIAGKTLTLCCFVNGTDNLAAHFTLTWMDKTGIMIQNYSGRDNNLSHTFYPNVSDAGPYVCSGIITSPYLDNSTLRINETLNVYVQIPQPTLTLTRDPDASVTLRHGDPLNLTCTIQLDTAVDSDVVVIGELSGPGGTPRNPTMVSDRRYQMILVVPLLSASSLETYNCTTVISPGMGDMFVSASKEHYITLNISVELRVSITVSYTPPPGVVLGPNEYRAASGPVNVTCTVMGASGSVSYQWSSTCRDCPFKEPDESTKQSIVRFAVHSGDTGSHNCTATANEDEGTVTGSSTIDFNVVGSGIHVFQGWPKGSLPNNGLVVANDSNKYYRMRFFCQSNSMNTLAGLLIGLNGNNVAAGNPLSISHSQPSELQSFVFQNATFGENHQGVYTCRIPQASGVINDINIGIYSPGFNRKPAIMSVSFMSGSSSSNITCYSTGSPATVVIWTVKNGLVLTMRDGNSTTVEGINYQLTQTVNTRSESSYTNVLTINTTSVENIFEYQCGVMNALGNSDMVNVTGAVIISTDDNATLGRSYTLNCTVIGIASAEVLYEWTGPDSGIHKNSSILTISSIGFQNVGTYKCYATIGSQNIFGTETVSVQIPKPAVTISSSAGTIHSGVYTGSVLALTCTVTINERVPQNNTMVIISWTKGSTDISNTADDERITVSNVQQIGTSLNYTSTIVFNTLQQSDAGEYRCQANISLPSPFIADGIDSDNHTITIQAHTVNITAQANPTVGENYTITCTVTVTEGVPGNLTADWSGPGVDMDGVNDVTYTNGSTFTLALTFNPLRQSHDGEYSCSARLATVSLTNSANTTIDATIPDISVAIFSGTGKTNVAVGERFLLLCIVSGANKLKGTTKIEWKHPSTVSAPSGIGTALEYPFTNVALTDAGLYTCNVTITDSLYLNNEITMSDTQELVISIPSPMVTITTNIKGIIYAGSVLEMRCTIILGEQVVENKQILVVNSRWTGPDGELTNGTRITLTQAVDTSSNGEYISTVTIDTLRESDSGTYSCMATVSHSESEFITDGMNTSSAKVNVQDPRINVSLMSNTTRLPNVPPYTFSLTCTATVPEGVVSPKTFTWWRRNAIINSTFTRVDSEAVNVVSKDIYHPISTSVLTAAETTTGTWHYQCTVALLELGNIRNTIIDADPIYVTGPTDPEPPTNFVASAIGTESATIYLFVPIIAFTPESYVVHYGTSNETIDSTSRPVEIANFIDKNFKLSIVLSDLMPKTLYFYLVNASNTQGFASSQIEMFTTKTEQDTSCINTTAAVGGAMGFVVTLLLTINIVFLALKYRKKKVTMVGEPCGSAKERKSDIQIVECAAYPKVNHRCGIDNVASSTFNISQHSNTTASIRNHSYEFVSREIQPQDCENTNVYETIH